MEELAKLFVLGVLVALAIAYLKYGPEGVRAWWEAKYLGQPQPQPRARPRKAHA